jgi:transposase InsO family protein
VLLQEGESTGGDRAREQAARVQIGPRQEFNSTAFSDFCEENGVKHFTTVPYTPQQNGVVERRNQTIVEMARCLLKAMAVPGPFWGRQ